MDSIDPQALKHYREGRRLTQAQLAERCGCRQEQVSRWERGKSRKVRKRLREPLAKALGIEWEALTRPPGPDDAEAFRDRVTASLYPKVQLNLRVSPSCRNALLLICERYHSVRPQDIVEFAPLLFFIVAEASLAARRKAVEELQAYHYEPLAHDVEMPAHLPELVITTRVVHSDEGYDADCLYEESKDIEQRDVLARKGTWDVENKNPFTNFLNKLAKEYELENQLEIFSGDLPEPLWYSFPGMLAETIGIYNPLDDDESPEAEEQRVRLEDIWTRLDLREVLQKKKDLDQSDFEEWIRDAVERNRKQISRELDHLFPDLSSPETP